MPESKRDKTLKLDDVKRRIADNVRRAVEHNHKFNRHFVTVVELLREMGIALNYDQFEMICQAIYDAYADRPELIRSVSIDTIMDLLFTPPSADDLAARLREHERRAAEIRRVLGTRSEGQE
jgi:hypothetical protein